LAVLGLDRDAALDEGGSGNPLRDGGKVVQDSREGGVNVGVWLHRLLLFKRLKYPSTA
jgi:hypothetical protein